MFTNLECGFEFGVHLWATVTCMLIYEDNNEPACRLFVTSKKRDSFVCTSSSRSLVIVHESRGNRVHESLWKNRVSVSIRRVSLLKSRKSRLVYTSLVRKIECLYVDEWDHSPFLGNEKKDTR